MSGHTWRFLTAIGRAAVLCVSVLQYVHAADSGSAPTEDTIFRLPADYALKEADVYRKWSLLYAADMKAFERDFQRTYQRVMQASVTHTPLSLLPFDTCTHTERERCFAGSSDTAARACFSCPANSVEHHVQVKECTLQRQGCKVPC